MLSGKPIISSADIYSETGSSLIRSGCGWITATDEAESWLNTMRTALDTNAAELQRMGNLGHAYAIQNFSSESGLKKINALLQHLNN
jgi:hypothetical protein